MSIVQPPTPTAGPIGAKLIDLLPRYEAALRARGQRPRGIEKYRWNLAGFFAWLGPDATMEALTAPAVRRYQEEKAATCSEATVGNLLTCIRSFCKWAMREGLRGDDPTTQTDWPRRSKPLPRPLKHAQVRAPLPAPNTMLNEFYTPRELLTR